MEEATSKINNAMTQDTPTPTKAYIGIDPGAKGFMTLYDGQDYKFYSIADCDYYQLADILTIIKYHHPNVVCVMEEVHAIFGSSAKGTFSFGEINGLLKGLLIANKIPYHLIPPKKWQSEIWENADKAYEYKPKTVKGCKISVKQVDTKNTSINAAKRLFPEVDLKRTPKCKNADDNKVDSLLICEYARRKNF